MLSLLIASILGGVVLIIFLLVNKRWKPCNIDTIQLKTKYYSNKVEEPLLCSYGDTEQIPMPEARREINATAIADNDEATVLVDVIESQTVDESTTTDSTNPSAPKKKSLAKMKPKNNFKRNGSENVGLLDSDSDEHLDFSLQSEVK